MTTYSYSTRQGKVPPGILAVTIMLILNLNVPAGNAETAGTMTLPDLSGVWLLNEQQSDDPQQTIGEALDRLPASRGGPGGRMDGGDMRGGGMGRGRGRGKGSGMGRPGGRGGGMGGGVGPGRAGRAGGPDGPEGPQEMLRDLKDSTRRLLITHDDPLLEIIDGKDRTLSLSTDGQVNTRLTRAGEVKESARWEDEELIVSSTSSENRSILRRYNLAPDRQQLLVTTRITLGRSGETVTLSLVYDLAR